MGGRGFEVVAHTGLIRLDAGHCRLQSSVARLDCIEQETNSAALVRQLVSHMLSRRLHRHESILVLGNEPFKGKVRLPFPQPCVEQLFVAFDFGFPLVITSVLVRQC
jgi:hypothetical protein